MPDESRQTLGIDIQITKSGSGGTDAAKEIKDATGATDKLTDATKEASKESEKFGGNQRDMARLFGLMGGEAREAAHAIHGIGEGSVLSGMFAVGLIAKVVIDKLDEAHQAAIKFTNLKWDAAINSANDYIGKINDLQAALDKASKSQDAIKDKYDEQLAVLERQLAALKQIADITSGGDKDKKAEAEKDLSEQGELQKGQLLFEEIQSRKDKQPQLESDAKYYASVAAAMAKNPAFIKAQADVQLNDSQKKELDEARLLIEQVGGKDKARAQAEKTKGSFGAYLINSALKTTDEYDANQALIAEQKRQMDEANRKQKEAIAAAAANQSAITDEQKTLSNSRQTFFTGRAGEEMAAAMEKMMRLASGQKLSGGDEQYLRSIGTMIAGHDVTTGQAEQMLRVAQGRKNVMQNFLERLMNAISAVPDFSKFEHRLQQLESKLTNTQGMAIDSMTWLGSH
ncbi:MAG TPA: hypothetical protein VFB72_19760 [Verrucomicrobiae bacterium]|nr:hypothetical protein [Verrucomicrobiae bacterium]